MIYGTPYIVQEVGICENSLGHISRAWKKRILIRVFGTGGNRNLIREKIRISHAERKEIFQKEKD